MSENSVVVLHKKIHQAALQGDMQTVADMIAKDVVWHSPGRNHVSGDFHGREVVMRHFFGRMAELSDNTAGFEDFQSYFGSEEYSAALFRWTATRNGKTMVYPVCEVIRWQDGQIAEEWGYFSDQYTLDAFWS